LAKRFNIYDKPGPRKVHDKPVPYLGGLSIFFGFFITVGLVIFMGGKLGFFPVNFLTSKSYLFLTGISVGSFLIVIMGVIDDIRGISAKIKFIIQILIAFFMYKCGVSIEFISSLHYGMLFLPDWLSILLTLFWITGITNAVNLLDGLDGLLAGTSFISGLMFAVITLMKGQYLVAILMFSISGACLGFLKYNFFPAKVFMGDSGSLFIGLLFASLTITGAFKSSAFLIFFIPVIIMGLPIFDTTYAIIRRFLGKQPIFKPDRGHIHHRLLNMGLSQKKAVLLIYFINILLGLIGIYIASLTIN
jgi:UDP-GlcNAc:undecaprenyl-phosphate GlcNAc-1-phosphate transferase